MPSTKEKTKENVTEAEEKSKENVSETEEKSKDEKVNVFIPKDPLNKNDDYLYVAVNGENCRIKKGEYVSVHKKFAEVIQRSQKTANEADEAVKQLTSEANSKELSNQ